MPNPDYYGSPAHARNEADAVAAMSALHARSQATGASATIKRLKRQVKSLKGLIAEHHSVGALDGFTVGQKCPVCNPKKVRRGRR